jgi:undecaprenyl-diphosphatase
VNGMDYFIEIIKYITLGIIQGITEIFPVSSSGHVALFSYVMFGSIKTNDLLSVILTITNMGSFIALLIFYFKDVRILVKDTYSFVFNKLTRQDPDVRFNFFYVLKLILAIIPIGIVGYLFKDQLNEVTTLLSIGVALIATSILLLLVWLFRNIQFEHEITWKHATIIGFVQMFAVIPVLSRSGITMVGGLSQKIEIKKVLRFSFLAYLIISVPVSILGIYDMVELISSGTDVNVIGLILAFLFSGIFSYITVKIMYQFVKVKNLIWFAGYAFILGLISMILFFI